MLGLKLLSGLKMAWMSLGFLLPYTDAGNDFYLATLAHFRHHATEITEFPPQLCLWSYIFLMFFLSRLRNFFSSFAQKVNVGSMKQWNKSAAGKAHGMKEPH